MSTFARILFHKRLRSSPFSYTLWNELKNDICRFNRRRLTKVLYSNKKQGTCDYCKRIGRKLTKEHLVPKSFGGSQILIRVCRKCNQWRGNSASYPDFLSFIEENVAVWRQAKREACPHDAQAFGQFLNRVKEALREKKGIKRQNTNKKNDGCRKRKHDLSPFYF